MERLNPLNDYIFQKLLGEKGDEEQLLSFLNAVLKRAGRAPLISVEIVESKVINAEIIGDKTSILDILAKTDDNTRVNIEVQLRNLGNMDRRSLFYWSRDYSRGIGAGDDYTLLPNVIAVNIVNFDFIALDDFHTVYHLWEDKRRHMLTDALEIHFIEMPKFRRLTDKDVANDALQRWLTYFDRNTPPEIVKELIKMDGAIGKADEKMAYISTDKEALRLYHMREIALSDWTSGVNNARREGIQEGERQKAAEIVKTAIKENLPLELIVKLTGLDADAVKELRDAEVSSGPRPE